MQDQINFFTFSRYTVALNHSNGSHIMLVGPRIFSLLTPDTLHILLLSGHHMQLSWHQSFGLWSCTVHLHAERNDICMESIEGWVEITFWNRTTVSADAESHELYMMWSFSKQISDCKSILIKLTFWTHNCLNHRFIVSPDSRYNERLLCWTDYIVM